MSHLKIGESKVLESRESPDGTMIRRRRVSLDGKHRFTTYERIERPGMMVRKRKDTTLRHPLLFMTLAKMRSRRA